MAQIINTKFQFKFPTNRPYLLWSLRGFLIATIFFHIFAWSFPFPTELEASKYLRGIKSDTFSYAWVFATRIIDSIFTFGYAKFAFVVIGILNVYILYNIFRSLANEYVALVLGLIFSVNSYILTFWHSTQPEIIVMLTFLCCIYLYVNFVSIWHSKIIYSTYLTTTGIILISLIMINLDDAAIIFIPSIFTLIFFTFYRALNFTKALLATALALMMAIALQTILQYGTWHIFNGQFAGGGTEIDILDKLVKTYLDGYSSSVWQVVHPSFNFIYIDRAEVRVQEFFVIYIAGFIFLAFLIMKITKMWVLIKRFNFKTIFYSGHIPVSLALILSTATALIFDLRADGGSRSLLAYQIISIVLLCFCSYSFLLRSAHARPIEDYEKKYSLMIYKPVAIFFAIMVISFGILNSYLYVAPYRGSNFPAIFDALGQVWKSADCSQLAYSGKIYQAAFYEKNRPLKEIRELYKDILDKNVLKKGCILISDAGYEGVGGNSNQGSWSDNTLINSFLVNNYQELARITLPFYQKDPAYPFPRLSKLEMRRNHSEKTLDFPSGDGVYRFGGMENIIIYKSIYE